ncbi:MAG: aspartyl protease family protein [Dehalococcoidia bacterium]
MLLELGRLRPFVRGRIDIPSQGVAGVVPFLVDTGADFIPLAPSQADQLRIDLSRLHVAERIAGIGGAMPTYYCASILRFSNISLELRLRVLVPVGKAQRTALTRIPSVLGRDVLSHFALFLEERTRRVLLLEPAEVELLSIP